MDLSFFSSPWFIAIISVSIIWDIAWKAIALWKAARNNHVAWFICIVVFNTVGLLPIVYVLLNRDKK